MDSKRDLTNENLNQLNDTKKDSWNYVIWAILGAIVFGVPFGFLGHFIQVDMLAPAGAALGAVIFMALKRKQAALKK